MSTAIPSPAPTGQPRVLPRSAAELLGVRGAPRTARERLIDKSIDLFYAHGFHAVGLDRILAETGLTKTTFYKHFESKEDLIVAAIQTRDEWESQAWRDAMRRRAGSDDPGAQALALFDLLDDWFNVPDYGGCMFLNAAIEFPDPRDPVHQAAAAHKRRARDEFRDLARAGGASVGGAEAFADLYTALFEGTLVLRHVHGRNDAASLARPMVARLVEEHFSPPESDSDISSAGAD